jgi:hypothetical protein
LRYTWLRIWRDKKSKYMVTSSDAAYGYSAGVNIAASNSATWNQAPLSLRTPEIEWELFGRQKVDKEGEGKWRRAR